MSKLKPLKKKLNFSINRDEAFSLCLKNNIKVYPVNKNGYWYIQVSVDDKIVKTYDKEIGKGSVLSTKKLLYGKVNWVDAIDKVIVHWAEKILNYDK